MDSSVLDTTRVITRVPPARPIATLADDVRNYLLTRPRSLPPKYFYDERGAWLFEGICSAPEYYPTRTETELLVAHAGQILAVAAPRHLLELGSGSSRKTMHLLDAVDPNAGGLTYWPFDVTEAMVRDAVADLARRYTAIDFHGLIGDYTGGLANLTLPGDGRRLAVFLGGTIGNFEPAAAHMMMADIRACLRPGDHLLIGFDRIKDIARLEAAYNDAGGYTAAFNRNVLSVLNRELDADFDLDLFAHRAFFNADAGRIEMHLFAERPTRIHLDAMGTSFDMAAGESIHTEISRKFSAEAIHDLLTDGGFTARAWFEDGDGDYALVLAEAI